MLMTSELTNQCQNGKLSISLWYWRSVNDSGHSFWLLSDELFGERGEDHEPHREQGEQQRQDADDVAPAGPAEPAAAASPLRDGAIVGVVDGNVSAAVAAI